MQCFLGRTLNAIIVQVCSPLFVAQRKTLSAHRFLCAYPRACAKRRARVLIPLGYLLHQGVLANIVES